MSVRGYAPWNPKPEAVYWVRSTLTILEEFKEYWPLSVRQIFYRLVAAYEYEKSEAAYGKLTGLLSRARRAGYIPWNAIRDGGQGRSINARYFEGADHFERSIRRSAETMKLDRQRDQKNVIELWCEAGGMVPILEGIAAPYSCRVNTGGGYDSVTGKHRLAERVRDRAEEGLKTVILHVGDFDGSGEDMANVLREDTMHMVVHQILAEMDADLRTEQLDRAGIALLEDETTYSWEAINWALHFFAVERVALTGEQVVEREVITAPPKRSDSRTKNFIRENRWVVEQLGSTDISAQLEALTPPELEALITETIEGHLDMEAYEAVLAEEEDVRSALIERLDR